MDKVKYIKLVLPVRYEDEDMPYDFPFRDGNVLTITYDYVTGEILNFPKYNINELTHWNLTLKYRVNKENLEQDEIFVLNDMKVTDEGCYYLLDCNLNVLYSLEQEYVPDSYSVDGEFGDYINLHIDFKNKKILNLKKNPTFEEFLNQD